MYRFSIWFGLLLIVSKITVNAQVITFKSVEDSLVSLSSKIFSNAPTAERELANEVFKNLLKNNLTRIEAFNYPFDSLKHFGKVKSDNGKIRVFTWNFPFEDGSQKYYGFILIKNREGEHRLVELKDNRKEINDPIKDILTSERWQGALYYSIIEFNTKEGVKYILLGLDFNSVFSSKKIIEVLSVSKKGEITFGADIFNVGESKLNRVIFEFSARASMMLRYVPESNTIVFDHLSPSRPDFAGNFQFYGPDFSYDGFRFEKGKWVYVQNLDLKNPQRVLGKPRESDEKFVEPGFLYKSKGGLPMTIKK